MLLGVFNGGVVPRFGGGVIFHFFTKTLYIGA